MDEVSASKSPFPPLADYAFLSNCHTGALVAPDGSVDWFCFPAVDGPAVFGNLLDRGAGSFRFSPYGVNVPSTRSYLPGTNVLTTTWHRGWLLVHDALTMGPRGDRNTVTLHTRPPADDDADHMLVRTVQERAQRESHTGCQVPNPSSSRSALAGPHVPG